LKQYDENGSNAGWQEVGWEKDEASFSELWLLSGQKVHPALYNLFIDLTLERFNT
jgi:hypothetical protein